MTDRQAAEARERWESRGPAEQERDARPFVEDLLDAVDALSARLDQAEQNSTDLRAVWKATERELAEERARLCEVEQERDEAIRLNEYEVLLRERDEAINDALNAEVRLREYEEALTKARDQFAWIQREAYGDNDQGRIAYAAARGYEALQEQGAASGGREAPDTKEPA